MKEIKLMIQSRNAGLVALFGLCVVAVGCQDSSAPLAPVTSSLPAYNFDPKVDAGWKGVTTGDAKLVADLKTRSSGTYGQSFMPRNDPFALLPEERGFERSQASERLLAESGDWRFDYTPPEDKSGNIVVEPQPYRSLAGVIVGDSVLALIDMGDGRPLEIIRPGQRIPNSEWTVVSIDEDKAILRRSGNKLPKQIVVRLESPPFDPGQNQGGNPGFGGPSGSGGPGRPSGGRPGPGLGGAGGGKGGPGEIG